jgi:hypothetical protein
MTVEADKFAYSPTNEAGSAGSRPDREEPHDDHRSGGDGSALDDWDADSPILRDVPFHVPSSDPDENDNTLTGDYQTQDSGGAFAEVILKFEQIDLGQHELGVDTVELPFPILDDRVEEQGEERVGQEPQKAAVRARKKLSRVSYTVRPRRGRWIYFRHARRVLRPRKMKLCAHAARRRTTSA